MEEPREDPLEELKQRRSDALAGGGPERIEKQHEKGKQTARERLDLLFDSGTFVELDTFVEHRATELGMEEKKAVGDAVITGYGQVEGRLIYAFAQDFTVLGGSLGEMHAKKITKVMDMAVKNGAPLIGINDSGGARVQEGIDALNGFGEIFKRNTLASGVIPQLSVVMGPCAGGAVYSPALTDFVFMVDHTSQMFITGPQVIETVTGESITKEELGGARAHNQKSGVAHFFAKTEEECMNQVKQLLSYLPDNNLADPPAIGCDDPVDRRDESLAGVVPADPNKPYDVREVIRQLVDYGEFFEIQAQFAMNAVVGFARFNGQPTGIVANQPRILAGCLDIDASDKIARFVRFCDAFNIPVLTFVDTPGYLPGTSQEHGGIIRHGAKILYAYSEATVPKISVILRKAYGGAYLAMCSQSLGADRSFAWPTAEVAVMGPEGACNIVFRREIEDAADPAAKRAELVEHYRETFANPYVPAGRGYVEDVLDPRDTRHRLIQALHSMAGKRQDRPGKKHGNLPT